jgi:hypothetical protein
MPIIKEESERTINLIEKKSQHLDMAEVARDMVYFGASITLKTLQEAIDSGNLGKIQEIRSDIRGEMRSYMFTDLEKTVKKEIEKHKPKPKQKTKDKSKMFSVKKEAENYKEAIIKSGTPEEAAKLAEDGVYLGVTMMLGVVAKMAEKGDHKEAKETLIRIKGETNDYIMSKIKEAF